MTGLRTNVADLLHHPGARRPVVIEAPVAGLAAGVARVAESDPLVVDVVLERVPEGIVVRGQVKGHWTGDCSRCLRAIDRELALPINELFETEPLEGETYPLEGDTIDLALPVRDAVLLELPLAPLCTDDCAGLCPVCGNDRNENACDCEAAPSDERWAPLRELRL